MPGKDAKFFLKGEEAADRASEEVLPGRVGKADGVFGQVFEASHREVDSAALFGSGLFQSFQDGLWGGFSHGLSAGVMEEEMEGEFGEGVDLCIVPIDRYPPVNRKRARGQCLQGQG